MINKEFDFFYEVFDTAKCAPPYGFLGNNIELNLHLVKP